MTNQKTLSDVYDPTQEFEQGTLRDVIDGNPAGVQSGAEDGPDRREAIEAVDERRRLQQKRVTANEPGTPSFKYHNSQVDALDRVLVMLDESDDRIRSIKSDSAARHSRHTKKRQAAGSEMEEARHHGMADGYEMAVESLAGVL